MIDALGTWAQNGLALLTGIVAGAVFAMIGLPVPAPKVLPGIVGILGLWLGYGLIEWVRSRS